MNRRFGAVALAMLLLLPVASAGRATVVHADDLDLGNIFYPVCTATPPAVPGCVTIGPGGTLLVVPAVPPPPAATGGPPLGPLLAPPAPGTFPGGPPAQPEPFPGGSFCRGDERMSFSPARPVVGNTVTVQVTSAQAATGVALSGRFDTAFQGAQAGGLGTIWSWTFVPNVAGQADFTFSINGAVCAAGAVFVAPSGTTTGTGVSTNCNGDELMTFNPSSPAVGQQVQIQVTSARASANVALNGPLNPQLTTITGGGRGTIWTWVVTPNVGGRYDYNFTVSGGFCTSGFFLTAGFTGGGVCNGDEAMSFNPSTPAVGQQVQIQVTSARASTNVSLSGPLNPQFTGVSGGGKGTIWTWVVTPNAVARYDYNFILQGVVCTSNFFQSH
jgi:hypothetical protein